MALPISEAWTGTNGSAWSAAANAWSSASTTGTVVDINSNTGRISTTGTPLTGYNDIGGSTLDIGVTDFDMYVEYQPVNTNEHYGSIYWRADSKGATRYEQPNNGYFLELANSSTISVRRYDATVPANLTSFSVTISTSIPYKVRVRVVGNTHQIRVWTGATEPTTWQYEFTDATYNTQTVIGLGEIGGSAVGAQGSYFDNLSIVTPPIVPTLVQTIGSATSQAAGTTLSVAFSGATKPQANDWIIVRGARDIVVADAPPTGDSISATPGSETYTRTVKEAPANAASGAGTGVVGVLFVAKVISTWPGGTNTITWTMPSVTAKAVHIEHWTNIDSIRASSAASGISAAGAPSVTSGSLTSGDLAIAMAAIEGSSTQAITADSDTSNGSWSTQITQVATGASGNATTARTFVKVTGQYKLVTGTATQTYNVTNANTTSVNAVAIIIGLVPAVVATTANLGTATLGISANNLTVSGGTVNANLGTASLGITAYNLVVGTGPYDWNSTSTDWNDASVDWNAPSAGASSNLGTGSFPLTANNLSGGTRGFGSATVAYSANPISSNLQLPSASIAFLANVLSRTNQLGTASVGFTANNLGSTDQLGTATLALIANGLTFGGQTLPSASLALAANLLGTSYQFSTATLALTAYGLTVAAVTATANLGNATVGFTANPFTFNDAIAVIAASLGISANALGFTDSISAGTATLGITASNLADSETTTAASLGLAATGLTASSRSLGTTTVPFSASGIATAGYALASASITAIANNLSLIGSFSLGTATVVFSASNLSNQTTGQSTLGRADLTVNAQSLSVSLSTGLSASLAMSATNLARAAVLGTSSLSLAAVGLTALRTASLGLASLVTTAYNMSQSAPGTAALGSGTLLLSANPMSRFALLSAGLATVALDAFAVGPKVNASGAVGSMSTAAQPMSSTRAIAKGILDLTAYGFGTYRPSTLGTAALTVTAYALSAQTGKSKGRISVRNGYVQFKTGGRGRTGLVTANPVSSFKKVGG